MGRRLGLISLRWEQLECRWQLHDRGRNRTSRLLLGLARVLMFGKRYIRYQIFHIADVNRVSSFVMAIAYHAKAAPPTVTMPRLKAMVSGAIGGFLDVAFNFNTQAFLDDNLLDHFYRIGWKLVMFGDNTWTKLFPSLFTRDDGVSSFYVKDTVEVDFNVSRHLEAELAASDWKLMILHYLGVDHVGHIGGRHSLLMAPKLKEMDDVIKMIHIHSSLNGDDHSRRMLLVVVSDHGMTESGNHGDEYKLGALELNSLQLLRFLIEE
ncbi:hypothetical protein HPP92_005641 [Vanilla planifolia]|uniref:GPI ethanolamine phosphate transferase 2 n=1 Tax=Vanilla planifolia TaxID=51239 RepID=A0A835VDE0_VANPL|nr:hypothetical protein HPP92_005641 [Vanilla planifolia]